jgi:hypothetical protein
VIISDTKIVLNSFSVIKIIILNTGNINNRRRCHCVCCEVKIDGTNVCGKDYTRGE